jgi:hypothetical protein
MPAICLGRPLSARSGHSAISRNKTGANVVFLGITPNGLTEALRLAADSGRPVWCGADAISEEAYTARKEKSLSRFIYPLGARDTLVLKGALDTID